MISEDVEMTLSGVEISPLGFDEVAVDLEQVSITIKPGQDSTSNPLDWKTLIKSIGGGIALLPGRGVARRVELCIEECLAGDLSWIRHADALESHFNVPGEHLQGSLLMSAKKSTISLTRYRDSLFIIDTDILTGDAEQLKLMGRARLFPSEPRSHFEARQPFNYAIDITSVDAEVEATLPLEGLVSTGSIKQLLEGRLTLSSRLGWRVDVADTTLSSQQTIALEAELNKGMIHVSLTSPVSIDVWNPMAEDASLMVAAGSECTISIDTNCTSPNMTFVGTLSSFLTTASISSIHLNLHNGNWQLSASADVTADETAASSINVTGASEMPNLLTAVLSLTAKDEMLVATTDSATILGIGAINLQIKQNLQTGKGELTVHAKKPATELASIAKNLGVQGLNIESGEITITLNLGWDLQSNADNLVFAAEVSANTLSLDFDGYEFHNGSIDTILTGWPRIQTKQPGTMSWDELNIGVPITNLNISFHLDLQPEKDSYEVTGNMLEANVFGGSLESDDYAYNLTREEGHLMLKLVRLELQQILALQQEEFESTGKISGSVPVHIRQGKLSVSKGSVTAVEPGGTISYKPSPAVAGLVAQNDQLKVVVDTMSDFQYHSLEAILEYSPEGDLVARVSLKGSNQAFENGREIHLNVNLEENLADLLKSLRLADQVSTGITRKAKDGTR